MNKNKPRLRRLDRLFPSSDCELALDDLFLASALQDVITIEQALAQRDYPAVKDTIHSLKGAAMIFRMTATVNAAQRIEAILNTGLDIDQAQLTAACHALRTLIDSPKKIA